METRATDIRRIIIIIGWIAAVMASLIFFFSHPTSASYKRWFVKEATEGGILKQKITDRKDLIGISLVGVTSYEVTEIFHEILVRTPGVIEAKRHRFILDPRRPHASQVDWQLRIRDVSPFQLEGNIYRAVRSIANNDEKGKMKRLALQSSEHHRNILKHIRPIFASSKEIRFHCLKERANHATKERSGSGGKNYWPDRGFE